MMPNDINLHKYKLPLPQRLFDVASQDWLSNVQSNGRLKQLQHLNQS